MWQWLIDSFNTAGMVPHGFCLQWRPLLLWTLVASDSLIAVSYFSIPFAIFFFANKRPDIPERWLFLLFGLFIIACGVTHLLDVLSIWRPHYWVNALAKTLTAALSFGTALVVWRMMPAALLAPSSQQLAQAKRELEVANAELEYRVQLRTQELAGANEVLQATLSEKIRLHEAIDREKALLRGVIDSIPDLIFFKDTEGAYLGCNKAFETYFGVAEGRIAGMNDFAYPEAGTVALLRDKDLETLSANETHAFEAWVFDQQGREACLETRKTPFRDRQGVVLGLIGICRNITERKLAEIRLQLAANVFTHAREAIIITDSGGCIIEVNDTFTQITGYSREESLGRNPSFLKSGRHGPDFYAAMWQAVLAKDHWYGEIWNRRKNGEVYAEMITISTVCDAAGKTQNYVALFTDITPMKEHQQQLEHIAHYDALTNLPNRVLLADRLRQAMSHSLRHHQALAVVYLDLDGFKAVNDQHDHETGDDLLIAVSQRMKSALREGDTLARIGGDEFVAVLTDLKQMRDCEPVLTRLLEAAADPVTVGGAVLQVSASIGVTLFPQDDADADQLLRHADQAMYIAKQAGKNRYHLFDIALDAAIKTRRESLEHIRQALDRREFVLHYQPKVNMKTGKVIGAEALIRWLHPERGLVLPVDFLPIVESHPISDELGDWVIGAALTQIGEWRAAGLDLPISVNVGARQLQQKDFVARLSAVLAGYPDVQSGCLELEVLETSALEDIAVVSANMLGCRELGIRFALDDFGTGYCSLTYLRRLPADMLKIDQSFVRDMLDDPDDLAIVHGVIGLAASFRRQAIAEGVESVAHGVKLMQMGCCLAQGYFIAGPMPAADMPAWVAGWKPDAAWGGEGCPASSEGI